MTFFAPACCTKRHDNEQTCSLGQQAVNKFAADAEEPEEGEASVSMRLHSLMLQSSILNAWRLQEAETKFVNYANMTIQEQVEIVKKKAGVASFAARLRASEQSWSPFGNFAPGSMSMKGSSGSWKWVAL